MCMLRARVNEYNQLAEYYDQVSGCNNFYHLFFLPDKKSGYFLAFNSQTALIANLGCLSVLLVKTNAHHLRWLYTLDCRKIILLWPNTKWYFPSRVHLYYWPCTQKLSEGVCSIWWILTVSYWVGVHAAIRRFWSLNEIGKYQEV